MKTALEFCKILKLDDATAKDIADLEEKVSARLGDKILFLAKETLKEGISNKEYQALLQSARDCGKEIGEHEFRMELVFAYYSFALLEEKYSRAQISKEVYWETMQDFVFRVRECQEVYGFTGIFVAYWYWIFCNLSLHKIGDLEFEKTVADFEYNAKGVQVKKGDPILAMHIPPKFKMSKETITQALKQSYEYYSLQGTVAYQCDSWLLYPDFEKVFIQGGNIMQFRSFFEVLHAVDHETFEDCWRVFKVGKIEDLNALPTDTRLQRNILKHLKDGGKTGDGFGVLVFDGENIL